MTTIGTNVLTRAADMLKEHLLQYVKNIDAAYMEADDTLTINLAVKLAPGAKGTEIITTITFVTGKVKDSGLSQVDENQMELPLRDAIRSVGKSMDAGELEMEVSR